MKNDDYNECLIAIFRILLDIYDSEKAIVYLYEVNKYKNIKI